MKREASHAWLILFLLVGGCVLTGWRTGHAQPTLTSFGVDQISFNSAHTGNVPDSEYGHLSFSVRPDASNLHFFQVYARHGAGSPAWVARNIPIPPLTQTLTTPFPMSTTIDLSQLGILRGTNVVSQPLLYGFSFTPAPVVSLTLPLVNQVPIGGRTQLLGGEVTSHPIAQPSLPQALPDQVTHVPFSGKWIGRPGMDSVEQGTNECGPGAVVNSMFWLQSAGRISLGPISQQQALAQIRKRMRDPWTGTGVSPRDTVEGKLKTATDHNLNMDIHFQADKTLTGLDGDITVGARTAKHDGNKGPPSFKYLWEEMKRGQDVELSLDWLDKDGKKLSGHVICVSGAYFAERFSVMGLTFHDDAAQASNGGLRKNHFCWVTVDGNGYLWLNGLPRNRVKAIYCESPPYLLAGDLVFTISSGTSPGGWTKSLDRNTGRVATLLDPTTTGSLYPNAITTGFNNQTAVAAYYDSLNGGGQLIDIDQIGIWSFSPIPIRVDSFYKTANGTAWNGFGVPGWTNFDNHLMITYPHFSMNSPQPVNTAPLPAFVIDSVETDRGWVVASWNTPPGGGLTRLDGQGNATQSISGLGQMSSVTYDPENDRLFATYYGTPNDPNAARGGLLEVDENTLAVKTLIDATTPMGATVDRLNWSDYERDEQLLLAARNKFFEYDLTNQTITKTHVVAPTRNDYITGFISYGGEPLTVDARRAPYNVDCRVAYPGGAGAKYFLAASLGMRPGLKLANGEWINLNVTHPLFYLSGFGLAPSIFKRFQGTLDTFGFANPTPHIVLPQLGGQVALDLYISGLIEVDGNLHAMNAVRVSTKL